jgi:hypothetical protein
VTLSLRSQRDRHLPIDRRIPVPFVLSRARSRALAGVLLAGSLLLGACFGPQVQRGFDLLNAERSRRGVAVLEPHADLARKAQGWAEHLAATGHLAHSDLRDGTPPGATVAENVGYGSSVDAVHQHLMGSSRHRANILRIDVTHAAVGVAVSGDGRTWVVQLFMG